MCVHSLCKRLLQRYGLLHNHDRCVTREHELLLSQSSRHDAKPIGYSRDIPLSNCDAIHEVRFFRLVLLRAHR